MSEKKLFLLDAMALIYRSFFAFQRNPRFNSKGMNTGAILGFANTVLEVMKNEKPSHIGVAFDTMAPTVRHEDFLEYKANREAMPEELSVAIPYIKKLLEALNIPILYVDGYEADDVIGTLAKKAEKNGFETYMMTPDKDFGQLVSDHIYMYKPARAGDKPQKLGVQEICDRYKIKKPEQLIDILGLWGDASDNIPGIPGIGEKRSMELIGKYESVENLIEHADELKGKLQENVIQFADQGLKSKALATIILDVPIDFNAGELKYSEPDVEALKELFEELEFRTFAQRFFKDLKNNNEQGALFETEEEIINTRKTIDSVDHHYRLSDSEEEMERLIQLLASSESFCFDTETTHVDANQAELVGISFSVKPQEAFYVPLPENYNQCLKIIHRFKGVLEDERIIKIGQNLKYDLSVLRWYEIDVKGAFFDTMIAHYLLFPDQRHNMDIMAENLLNYTPVSLESLIGKKGKNQLSVRDVDLMVLKDYACEDADITLQLKILLEEELHKNKLVELYQKVEAPLIKVLCEMETTGVKLDANILTSFGKELENEIIGIQQKIWELAGVEFNIASPKQMGEVLFDKLKVTDKPKLTKTKQYATGEDVLIKLLNKHPIIQLILDFRSLTKLKSTYVDTLPELVNKRTNRIHTSYNQAVAATGRLSSNNPNLQNIPIRTEKGREIRKAFVPSIKDNTLLAADYSQIELRIIASLSGDENMIKAFNDGLDIHAATASRVYDLPIEKVNSDQRRNAKTVNFGIIYGISPFGLSERLSISRQEAKSIIDQYFTKYPGIKTYMDQSIEFAREKGYVETILERRRYLPDIQSRNATVRGFAERNAINAPIQGSSADMIKIAMINIFEQLNIFSFKSKMILQVHDELVFDVVAEELEAMKKMVHEQMVKALPLKVPVVVDMNTGNNWLEAH